MSSNDRLRLDAGFDDIARVRSELRKLDDRRADRQGGHHAPRHDDDVPARRDAVPLRLDKGLAALATIVHSHPGEHTASRGTAARPTKALSHASSEPRLPVETEPGVLGLVDRIAGSASRWMSAGTVIGLTGLVIVSAWLPSPSATGPRDAKPFVERVVGAALVPSPVRSLATGTVATGSPGPGSPSAEGREAVAVRGISGVDRLLGLSAIAAPGGVRDDEGGRASGTVRTLPPPQDASTVRPAPRPASAQRPTPSSRPGRPAPRRSAEKSTPKPTRR